MGMVWTPYPLSLNPRMLSANMVAGCEICRCLTPRVSTAFKWLLVGAVICLFLISTVSWSSSKYSLILCFQDFSGHRFWRLILLLRFDDTLNFKYRQYFHFKMVSQQGYIMMEFVRQGFFFAILGRGPRAFQIGKISAVNHYLEKFSKQTRTAFLVSLKTKLAITHTIAIKLKENRMQF